MINRLIICARYLCFIVEKEIIYSCLQPVRLSGVSMGLSTSQSEEEDEEKELKQICVLVQSPSIR